MTQVATRWLATPSAIERLHTADSAALGLIDALRDHVRHVMRAARTPGLNLALALGNRLVWEAGFGLADVAKGIPTTPDTIYHSGSLGKTYTGTAIMVLVDRGLLALEDPINRYLPFTVRNPLGAREITVLDLLTHRSGLGGDGALSLFTTPRPLAVELEAEYGKPNSPMFGGTLPRWATPVGATWCYSNLGLATLGLIVEHANPDGQSFADFVQSEIMAPLGMSHSQYPPVQDATHVRPELWKLMSQGYSRMGAALIPTLPVYFGEYPAGGVVQRPSDHLRLLLALMNGGELDGRRVLSDASVARMLTPASPEPLSPTPPNVDGVAHQGLIWRLNDRGSSNPSFDHGGGHMFGWRTQGRAWPAHRAALAIGANQWSLPEDSQDVEQITGFVGQWLKYRASTSTRTPATADWPGVLSYVRGALFVAAYSTMVGIPGELPDAALDSAVRDTRLAPAAGVETGTGADWDAAAFRDGIRDLTANGLSVNAVKGFWTSSSCRVTGATLQQALAVLGTKSPGLLSPILPPILPAAEGGV